MLTRLLSGPRSRFTILSICGLAAALVGACATDTGTPQSLGGDDSGSGGGGTDSTGGTAAGNPTAGSPMAGMTATGGGGAGGTAAGTGGGGTAAGGLGGGGVGGVGGAAGGGMGGMAGSGGADACPNDPDKTDPGKCGCGVPEVDGINGAGCGPLQDSLIHRYSFTADAKDSVGTAHGTLMGGATISGGQLVLAGAMSGQYLDLPNGLISGLQNVTIEVFVTWNGTGNWQRVFDFGTSDMGEGLQGSGNTYLFLSAQTDSTTKFRGCYQGSNPKAEVFTDSTTPFPTDPNAEVALSFDSVGKKLTIFNAGNNVGQVAVDKPLSNIADVNNWVGRSQYAADTYYGGKITEIRIYNIALTGPQLKASVKMGPDTTYLTK